ncbi:MAG: FAD-binding protein [Lachnospiraceae bacterium]|nr:FAD-binding protein [Lachnospiraceae bacterium]
MLITESVRGDGAILVNQEGKRFTNELLTRDKVSAAELEQTGGNAVADIVVFGKVASESAVEYCDR